MDKDDSKPFTNLLIMIIVANSFPLARMCVNIPDKLHPSFKPCIKSPPSGRGTSRVPLGLLPTGDSGYSFEPFLEKVGLVRDCISNLLKPRWGCGTGANQKI